MKCKLCGGYDIVKLKEGVFYCNTCGTKIEEKEDNDESKNRQNNI
jgi:uncharacterized Zn finger protein (UPF0148 family)